MNDKEFRAAKHCMIDMEGARGVYLHDFFETSNNEYAKAFRRHVEETSDTMRSAVEWIREGKAEMAADYLEGFIVPVTFEVPPAVNLLLKLNYQGDKRNYDDAVADLEALEDVAAEMGLKISFEPA